MSWWLWMLIAVLTFVGGIAVGAASYWFAESAGPLSELAVTALGASLLMSYVAAPGLAVKGVAELLRTTRRR